MNLNYSPVETHIANGQLTAGIPGGELLVRVLLINTTGNAITGVSFGTSSGGDDIIREVNIPANSTYDYEAKGTGKMFSISAGQSFWISAATWNSGSIDVTLGRRGLKIGA